MLAVMNGKMSGVADGSENNVDAWHSVAASGLELQLRVKADRDAIVSEDDRREKGQ
jgi:hypothetical protein